MYDSSEVQFAVFLSNVANLFNDTLNAVYNVLILRFFLTAILLFMVVSLLARLIRQGGKGKL